MTKYKLTTDLIADCMALIPDNLDRLNEWQEDYLFEIKDGDILFTPAISYNTWGLDGFLSLDQYIIISHCLRTIPEFKDENPELENNYQEILEISKLCESDSDSRANWHLLGQKVQQQVMIPQTIASATLHGQGEYPPSTLEELCESYKKVMSK